MSASLRARFRGPREDAPSNIPRKPVPPPKPTASESSRKHSHVSDLAKRASRSLTSGHSDLPKPTQIPSSRPARAATTTGTTRLSPAPEYTAVPSTVTSPPPSSRTPRSIANSTPSLASGSTVSPSYSSPKSHSLRRKAPNINRYVEQKTSPDPFPSNSLTSSNARDNTVLGIYLPTTDLQGREVHREWTPLELPPSVAHYAMTATPSTRYTDSPFSSAPTPSSMSSYTSSPAVHAQPNRSRRELTPNINKSPPPARPLRNSQSGLPPVRESSTSSSNSTVKPNNVKMQKREHTRLPTSSNNLPTRSEKSFAAPTASSATRSQRSASSSNVKSAAGLRIYPELAHLAHDNLSRQPSAKSQPRRPSRDGVPEMDGVVKAFPIVQSDLPVHYTTYHKRTPSQEVPPSPSKSRLSLISRGSSRRESPRIDSARPDLSSTTPPTTRIPATTAQSPHGRKVLRKDSPAVTAPSPSKSPGRSHKFGLFSRRSKTEEPSQEDKSLRRNSKGPAAGTGHEGYGRFASTRGRGGSIASSAGGRSTSVASTASNTDVQHTKTRRGSNNSSRRVSHGNSQGEPELDDYLFQRLQPIYLRGSGSTGSVVSNAPVSAAEASETGLARSSTSTSIESYPEPQLLPSTMQQTRGKSPAKRPSMDRRMHSDVSDAESETPRWTQLEKPRRSKPLDDSPKKPSKWNFFQRAQSSVRSSKKPERAYQPAPATFDGRVHGVAHYALVDETYTVHLQDVEHMLHDNEMSADEAASEIRYSTIGSGKASSEEMSRDAQFTTQSNHRPEVLRLDSNESPEILRAQTAVAQASPSLVQIERSPSLVQHIAAANTLPSRAGEWGAPKGDASAFQSRLSPVGRIPRVVSKRDRDRKLSANSFSRPFASSQPRPAAKPPLAPGSLYTQIREHASPEPGAHPISSSSTGSVDMSSSTLESTSGTATNRTSVGYGFPYPGDFLAFTARKGSDVSYSSSNTSKLAIIPPPPPQQDDPWAEYNDLIDDMLPARTPISASSSFGMPFQYSVSTGNSPSIPPPLNLGSQPPSAQLPPVPRLSSTQAVLSVPEQIAQLMKPSMSSLVTSHTLSDLFEDYGQRGSLGPASPNRTSIPQLSRKQSGLNRYSTVSTRCSVSSSRDSLVSHSRSTSMPDVSQLGQDKDALLRRNSQLMDIAEVDVNEPAKVQSLRSDALTVSQWLLRGQVLFSPAQDSMKLSEGSRILVVDGLGSDWSYHVALQYPQAPVYNLGPIPTIDEEASVPQALRRAAPNHKHIPHAGLSASFPFPKGFFSVVVFRFPVSNSNEAYHAALGECKRVLRPGGYLEVAVLDLDLKNMGPVARKAVRNLKIRMQYHDKNISLANLSDVLVRIIGRRGFEEVQCCLLGLPVTGTLRPSNESQQREDDMTSRSASVGRWWYSRCYESALHGVNRTDIWNDKLLLRECQLESTSFRMLVCHAQKPTQTRRRTVSV